MQQQPDHNADPCRRPEQLGQRARSLTCQCYRDNTCYHYIQSFTLDHIHDVCFDNCREAQKLNCPTSHHNPNVPKQVRLKAPLNKQCMLACNDGSICSCRVKKKANNISRPQQNGIQHYVTKSKYSSTPTYSPPIFLFPL